MTINRTAAAVVALFGLSISAPAMAHPHLLASSPAANASVMPTNTLVLHFSEPLVAKFTGADITALTIKMGSVSIDRPVMLNGVVAKIDAADKKTLVLTVPTPLSQGRYRVDWRAVSTDTHRLTGTYSFSVR